jgi:hypothetical protein
MAIIEDLPNTRVMAPLGNVLHKGIVAAARADQPLDEGMVCIEFIPPVKAMPPYASIDYMTCAVSSVMLGWWLFDNY